MSRLHRGSEDLGLSAQDARTSKRAINNDGKIIMRRHAAEVDSEAIPDLSGYAAGRQSGAKTWLLIADNAAAWLVGRGLRVVKIVLRRIVGAVNPVQMERIMRQLPA
jgi:hypothetical protein